MERMEEVDEEDVANTMIDAVDHRNLVSHYSLHLDPNRQDTDLLEDLLTI